MVVNCPGCICSYLVGIVQSYEYLLFYVCNVVVLVALYVYCFRTCAMCVLLYLLNYVCVPGVTLDAELLP